MCSVVSIFAYIYLPTRWCNAAQSNRRLICNARLLKQTRYDQKLATGQVCGIACSALHSRMFDILKSRAIVQIMVATITMGIGPCSSTRLTHRKIFLDGLPHITDPRVYPWALISLTPCVGCARSD